MVDIEFVLGFIVVILFVVEFRVVLFEVIYEVGVCCFEYGDGFVGYGIVGCVVDVEMGGVFLFSIIRVNVWIGCKFGWWCFW